MALTIVESGEVPRFFRNEVQIGDSSSKNSAVHIDSPIARTESEKQSLGHPIFNDAMMQSRGVLLKVICELGFQSAIVVRQVWKAHWIAKSYAIFFRQSSNFWVITNFATSMYGQISGQELLTNTALAFMFTREAVYSITHLCSARQQTQYLYKIIQGEVTPRLGAEIWSDKKVVYCTQERFFLIKTSRMLDHLKDLFFHGFQFSMHTCNMKDICYADPHFNAIAQTIGPDAIRHSNKVIFEYLDKERKLLLHVEKYLNMSFSTLSLTKVLDEKNKDLWDHLRNFFTSGSPKKRRAPEKVETSARQEALSYQASEAMPRL